MTRSWILACVLGSASMLAQTAPPVAVTPDPKPKNPPVISVELREKYFKAQSEYQVAASALKDATRAAQDKQSLLQEQINKLIAICGKGYVPTSDPSGEVVCTEAPKGK